MRHAVAAAVWLIAQALPAAAFEIEAEHRFGPPDPAPAVSVLATTDIGFFTPLAEAFVAANPGLAVHYTQAASTEVHLAIESGEAAFDLVISAAMDLQMKLANDGFARALPADVLAAVPGWARWRDRLVAVAQEPAVLLLAQSVLEGRNPPRSRHDLIALLRDHPQDFAGRIATYDPQVSGVGYLFLTQDDRLTDSIWRLAEVMGRLNARLFCCSGQMIDGLVSGDLVMAYNVLGTYAAANLPEGSGVQAIELEDFTLALQRVALIPQNARRPDLGARLLEFLVSPGAQAIQMQASGGAIIAPNRFASEPWLRPIRLDAGLLSSLDAMSRLRFLAEWSAALDQP